MEPEGSLSYSQVPAINPYPEATVVVQVGLGAGTMVAWLTITALEHWVLWVHLPTVVVQVGFGASTMVAWRTSWKYITGI